jgi:hypothetical protein
MAVSLEMLRDVWTWVAGLELKHKIVVGVVMALTGAGIAAAAGVSLVKSDDATRSADHGADVGTTSE